MDVDAVLVPTPTHLVEVFQDAGYRAELKEKNGVLTLYSKSNGFSFEVFLFEAVSTPASTVKSIQFSAVFAYEPDLKDSVARKINRFNSDWRFGKAWINDRSLVIDFDVMMHPVTTRSAIKANLEMWDTILGKFLIVMREPDA